MNRIYERCASLDDAGNFKQIFSGPNIAGLALSIGLNRILPDIETIEGHIAQGATNLAISNFLPNLHGLGSGGIFGAFHPVPLKDRGSKGCLQGNHVWLSLLRSQTRWRAGYGPCW